MRYRLPALAVTLTLLAATAACGQDQGSSPASAKSGAASTSTTAKQPTTAKEKFFALPAGDHTVTLPKAKISGREHNYGMPTKQVNAALKTLDEVYRSAYLDFSEVPDGPHKDQYATFLSPEANADFNRQIVTGKSDVLGVSLSPVQQALVRDVRVTEYRLQVMYAAQEDKGSHKGWWYLTVRAASTLDYRTDGMPDSFDYHRPVKDVVADLPNDMPVHHTEVLLGGVYGLEVSPKTGKASLDYWQENSSIVRDADTHKPRPGSTPSATVSASPSATGK